MHVDVFRIERDTATRLNPARGSSQVAVRALAMRLRSLPFLKGPERLFFYKASNASA